MTIIETLPRIQALIESNPEFAGIPILTQLDPQYQSKYEAALDAPGIVFTLWAASGDPANGNSTPILDLQNNIVIAIVENLTRNTTGKTSLHCVHQLLRQLHHNPTRIGTSPLRHHPKDPAYELGPLTQGLVLYNVNILARSTEELPLQKPAPTLPSPTQP